MWRAELLVDGQDAAAGQVSWSVEDFVPQRLRVAIEASEVVLRRGQSRPINVQADFLYGVLGSGLAVEAEGRLMVDPNPFPGFEGYTFGCADESFDAAAMFRAAGHTPPPTARVRRSSRCNCRTSRKRRCRCARA